MKRKTISILFCLFFCLALYGGDGTYEGDNPHYGMSESELEKIIKSGNDKQSKDAEHILSEMRRIRALLDRLNALHNTLGSLYSKVMSNGASVQDLYAMQQLSAQLSQAEKEAEEAKKKYGVTNLENLFAGNSATPGDPVKITRGTYEQIETDIQSGKNELFLVVRQYDSSSVIVSSFGYGWSTNLDQRIILGIYPDAQYIYNKKAVYSESLKSKIESIKETILEYYQVSSLESAVDEINNRLSSCSSIESEAISIGNDSAVRSEANSVISEASSKYSELQTMLEYLNLDFANLHDMEEEYEKSIGDRDSYFSGVLLPTLERKNRNSKAMFSGMDASYEQTGLDTLTVIDEGSYPHLLYETSKGSGVWKNVSDKSIIKCEKKEAGYAVYIAGGCIKEYDENGFLIKVKDRNGNFMKIVRDGLEKICSIEDSFGEKYCFEYSGKYISKISNYRFPEESTEYIYNGNKLTGVKDTDGDSVIMEYNPESRMKALNKCDGSTVTFTYGLQASDGAVLATATTNEEGFSEHFEYDRSGRKADYIDHDGNRTVYWYDSSQRTVRELRSDGTEIRNEYDENGNLKSISKNGNIIVFGYDGWGNKISASYSDGSHESWTYDDFNLITSYTDRDSIEEVYRRDDRGNVIEYVKSGKTVYKQDFNERGQVIKRTLYGQQKVVTDYSYDSFGNLRTEKTGGIKKEYKYDACNRVTEIIISGKKISEYEYDKHKTVKKDYNGLETTYLTNGRKDLTEIIQKDNETDVIHKTRIVYDKRHLPITIYEGNGETEKIINSYLYTPEGKLKAEVLHGDESFIKVYEYKNGQISDIKQFKTSADIDPSEYSNYESRIKTLLDSMGEDVYVQQFKYQILNKNRKILTLVNGLGKESLLEYDSYGNLVKKTDENGQVLETRYTKAGSIKEQQNSYGGWYEYGYNNGMLISAGEQNGKALLTDYYPDGSIKSQTDRYGKVTYYNYDDRGRVSSIQSEARKAWYEYDSLDRVINQVVGNTSDESTSVYYETYEYYGDGRKVTATKGGKYRTVNELDAFGNVIKQTDGNNNERSLVYNFQNQLIESYDPYNNKISYEYNALGTVSKVTLPDGAVTNYEYNYMGQLSKVSDNCGVVYEAAYDKVGRLAKERNRSDTEKSYEYDAAGRITKVLCGGEVVESYSYGPNNRTVTVKDGNGHDYLYNYDGFGRLVNERNRAGLEQNYYYDEEGQLKTQINFDNSTTTINYSPNRTIRTVNYSDGSQNRFVYDAIGNIIEAENAYGKTIYQYDQGGQLIYQKDVTTGEEIYFEYDDAGNRIRLYSTNRETKYTYGKNNEVKEIFDNKQRISIKLSYDKNGREVLRKFGNGTEEATLYDKAGRVTVKMQKSERGELLWGEGYTYGSDGKRTATVDNSGRVTLYEYNNKGQLETVYYPYTKDLSDKLKEEAEENGLNTVTDVGENKYLTSSLKSELVVLMNAMQYGLSYNLTNLHVFIRENYTYDKNGNRKTKTTPYGTIDYTYDKENCLLSSGSRGQQYVNYTYDKMGNLLTEESPNKTTKYAYNTQNRLIYCEVTDKSAKEYAQTTYSYDAFGRRIIVQDKGEAALRTLYDGLTFDVIKQGPVFESGISTDLNNTGIKYGPTGRPTGDRYRYLSDDDVNDGNRYFFFEEGSYKTTTGRYRGERTTVTVNGTLAAQTSQDYGTEYFTTDLFGSISNVTDSFGAEKASYSYDAFGSLIQGNLTGTSDFGYLGKQNDLTAGLYNYGYRDYKPQTSRFTTQDPIRDGTNWFLYCNGDPVNFVDIFGLCTDSDYTNSNLLDITKLLFPSGVRIGLDSDNNTIIQVPTPNKIISNFFRGQNPTKSEQLSTDKKDHHVRNGIIEIGSGVAVWILGGITVYNTMQKDPESLSKVGYSAIITGSTLIANGIGRVTGSSQTSLKEDYISLLQSPLGEAVKEYNNSENPNGIKRSPGRTIDYSNEE